MELDYRTRGTCSSSIHVELDGRKIKRVVFTGGCNGNLQGISRLVEGMDIDDVIARGPSGGGHAGGGRHREDCGDSLRQQGHVMSRPARPRA